jgi:soluble cytochrome b562
VTLVISTDAGKRIGRIRLRDGTLAGSNKGTQRLADYALRKAGGDVQRAYQALSAFSNGYLDVSEEPDAMGLAFDPLEARDKGGKWFHGTSFAHQPGDVITPGGSFDRLFVIPSQKAASHYARTQAMSRYSEGDKSVRPHIYEVEPVGPITDEAPAHQGSSAKKLRIVREVPFQAPYQYAYAAPWETPPGAATELGWRFNPLEHRNAHGEWSRDGSETMKALSGMKWGEGKQYRAPPADRMSGSKKASDNLFIRKYGLSAANIVAAYDDANADERDEGMRWYSDAHTVARMIGGGDADKGAALLSAFSPQTDWQTNAINAAHTIELGRPPEHGTGITGAVQDKARAILARDKGPYDDLFPTSAQKTNAFYKLIRNGGDTPGDEDGLVVMDRHALSVAAGRRLTKDQTDTPSYADVRTEHPDWDEDQVKAYRSTLPPAPVGSVFTYQHMADMYREAARRVSERDGTQVSPHQMQAITWLRQQRKNNELDAALVAQGEEVVKAGGKMGSVHGAKESKGRFSRASKAWAAWEGYAAGHTIATHLGTTAVVHENPITVSNTITGQLDLAGGWHDAWRHELRGRHGEWGAGPAGLIGEGDRRSSLIRNSIQRQITFTPDPDVRGALVEAMNAADAGDLDTARTKIDKAIAHANVSHVDTAPLVKLRDSVDRARAASGTAKPDYSHVQAQLALARSHPDAYPVYIQMIDDAATHLDNGEPEKAKKSLRLLADFAVAHPSGMGTGSKADALFFRKMATEVTRQAGKGKPKAPPKPKLDDAELSRISDSLSWLHEDAQSHGRADEGMDLRDAVGAVEIMKTRPGGAGPFADIAASHLLKAAATADKDPDGGKTRAEQYRGLANRISPGSVVPPSPEIAAVKDFLDKNAAAVPVMFGEGAALNWDGKPPTEFAPNVHPSYLAQMDWNGHMNIQDERARRIQAIMSGTGPIDDPDAPTVVLHEMIHQVMPAGDVPPAGETDRVNMAAYQVKGVQAIEEGFTQHGTALHAEEFFRHAGLADRKTPFPAGLEPSREREAKLSELRQAVGGIQRRLADPALPHSQFQALKAATALSNMVRDLRQNDVGSAKESAAPFMHLGWPEFSGDNAKVRSLISEFSALPENQHLTMAEYAQKMADPALLKSGDSWPHYATWTASAQKFGQTIAELGGKSAGDQAEVRRVSDAVNSVGAARKSHVMAELTMAAAGLGGDLTPGQRDAALSSMEATIEGQWLATGPDQAVRLAAKQARQQIQAMKMSEAA